MFKSRRNSQKPTDELYEAFKLAHSSRMNRPPDELQLSDKAKSKAEADAEMNHDSHGQSMDSPSLKDHDAVTRESDDQWSRFTPSIMDPNSYAFANFANQPPGYYTPTPGGGNTLHHNQRAGDLHTPNLGIGLNTPLSLPTSDGAMHVGQVSSATMHSLHAEGLAPGMFTNTHPFGGHASHSDFDVHPYDSTHGTFGSYEHPHVSSPGEDMSFEATTMHFNQQSSGHTFGHTPNPGPSRQNLEQYVSPRMLAGKCHGDSLARLLADTASRFRYRTTLSAPTAMVDSVDEDAMTYLNKGQPYTLTVQDHGLDQKAMRPTTYRTFVRVSFDGDEFREKPAYLWQLWKEGRGSVEAHQRDGRLQAVEFVDSSQASGGEAVGQPRIELEQASFDGFAVIWTADPSSVTRPSCSIVVRFNFLSTDFSHSKGVKGSAMRLCAKTEVLHGGVGEGQPEICFCKVQLFRDHGAERKFANDQQSAKKQMAKIRQHLSQLEQGLKEPGKRKRSAPDGSNRPHKIPKHKRTFSASSAGSSGNKVSPEDELREKVNAIQAKLLSNLPVSTLSLRGEPEDDPDLFPVHLPKDAGDNSTLPSDRDWTRHGSISEPQSSRTSAPAMSSTAFHEQSHFMATAGLSTTDWSRMPGSPANEITSPPQFKHRRQSDTIVKVKRTQSAASHESDWMEVSGIDSTYNPPAERAVKPAACFYARYVANDSNPDDKYYRAVYVMQRTLKDFVNTIAMKGKIEPTQVLRAVHINMKGYNILMDDDVVLNMPEGQDMLVDFVHIRSSSSSPLKRNAELESSEIMVDGDININESFAQGYELRLRF